MQVAAAASRPKQVAKAARAAALRFAGPALAPAMRYVALYAHGTDACVRRGFLPLPVHFSAPPKQPALSSSFWIRLVGDSLTGKA